MIILASFVNSGAPATGLLPTIRIRELATNTLVVTDAAMTEVGDGMYSYDFTTYDNDVDYGIRCDGTATLANSDRYVFGSNDVGIASTNTDTTVKVLTGKWEIVGNQLIMYDTDGTTALYTYDLANAAGTAASIRIFKRTPA